MQRRTPLIGALASTALVALVATGCAAAPDDAPTDSTGGSDFLACAASDVTGFHDGDFNELSLDGVTEAADEVGAQVKTAESSGEDQYVSSIGSLVDEGCQFIVTVGFALASATRDSAKANPDVNYALIDSVVTNDDFSTLVMDNVKPVLFDTAQAAVLAGYLSAGATTTGTVATYGGMPFPSVTIFMDGFADGIDYYNEKHGTSVKLLGWDKGSQNGSFVGSFDDQLAAKTITEGFLDQGADIVMPVAGTLYGASLEAIKGRGVPAAIVGVNSDVFERSPADGAYFLTSVMKNLTTATHEVTLAAAKGQFDNTPYIGTLENGGVGIAPTHDWEAKLPKELLAEGDQLPADIISGAFTVDSPSSPKL